MTKRAVKPIDQTKPRWQRQPDARPDQILDAALGVFRAQGFSAARMDDVAKAAGISKGTIYLYFNSKQTLMESLITRAVAPIAQHLNVIAAQAPDGPVTPVLRAMLTFAASNLGQAKASAVPMLVISEAGRFPELARLYRQQVIDIGLGAITGMIKRGINRGEFRKLNPAYAARSMIAPLLMHMVWMNTFVLSEDEPIDLPDMIEQHLDIFLHGAKFRAQPEVSL